MPDVGVIVAVPLLTLGQLLVEEYVELIEVPAVITIVLVVPVQPSASVNVTVYVPADKLLKTAGPLFVIGAGTVDVPVIVNVKGAVPNVGVTEMVPSVLPGQVQFAEVIVLGKLLTAVTFIVVVLLQPVAS